MSGIFGRYDSNGRKADSIINEIGRWNKPYGENGYIEWNDSFFFAGAYIDRMKKADEMLTVSTTINGMTGIFDTLLFNKEELASSEEMNCSDEDVLFNYIVKNGFNALKNVNGDFSGAVYDYEGQRLILFRDHMGVRPLYYTVNNKYVAFSTDIRGICGMSDYDSSISEKWVYNVINGYPNYGTENTAYDNIKCVPPGHYLIIDLKTKKENKIEYWKIGRKRVREKNEKEYMNVLRGLIEDSVKRRLAICEDPIGAELSGGLDSGIIDILINRNGRKGFFVSWSASPEEVPYVENDERYLIRDICEQENIECIYTHQQVTLEKESRTIDSLKQLNAYDADASLYAIKYTLPPFANTLTVTEGAEILKKCGAKVVFTGHGGDEGVSHRASSFEMFHYHEYYHYLRYMFSRTHGKKRRLSKTIQACFDDIKKYREEKTRPFSSHWASPEIINLNFKEKYKNQHYGGMSFRFDPVEYIRGGGSRSRLDNIAMQGGFAGVKYLIPYLDYRVVDYAVSIPRYMFLHGNMNRYIFREAFKDIMPKSLYSQKAKRTASREGNSSMSEWFEAFDINRKYVYDRLDRSMWKDFLNFDFLDEWIKAGVPSEEESQKMETIYANIFQCLLIQNTLEKTKM